jgi:hypothetical protein
MVPANFAPGESKMIGAITTHVRAFFYECDVDGTRILTALSIPLIQQGSQFEPGDRVELAPSSHPCSPNPSIIRKL